MAVATSEKLKPYVRSAQLGQFDGDFFATRAKNLHLRNIRKACYLVAQTVCQARQCTLSDIARDRDANHFLTPLQTPHPGIFDVSGERGHRIDRIFDVIQKPIQVNRGECLYR